MAQENLIYQKMRQPMFFKQKGFSLFEVLISLLILSVVVLGFLAVQADAVRQSKYAEKQLMATAWMSSELEHFSYLDAEQKEHYAQTLQSLIQASKNTDNPVLSYQRLTRTFTPQCFHQECSKLILATDYAMLAARQAANQHMMISVVPCRFQFCMMAFWGHYVFNGEKDCQKIATKDKYAGCIMIESD